jgi:predicted ATPase
MVEQPPGTVTLVFTDIEGSTRLLHELGQDAYRGALAEHRRIVREAFARHDGYEVDYEGDAFFYAFASAREAVQAVADAQGGLAAGPIRIRVGIHTGEPALDPPKYVGADVHLAARVMSAGHGGQVLLSEAARALVDADARELGKHRLKDFDEPVSIYQIGQESFPLLKTVSNTNLPKPLSSFVGREREVGDVVSLVRKGERLVTLSGPGGSGKTRLAVEAASEAVGDFPGGVFWVGLATVREPALVMDAIAQTLGAKDDVAAHLGTRRMLLLLDNLEQVIDAAPHLADLLGSCPNLQLLVTSRELLRVQGERAYEVPPLAEPEAVELFCVRARLDHDATIGELCSRLDNLPLAVELAAARTRVLGPAQILERLTQRLDLLKGGRDTDPRQQTLRATIEWSHDLLKPDEQQLFALLAVFARGCTVAAAEDITGGELGALQSLVDKSLVRHSEDRFSMLETIREFADERLSASGAADTARRRHAEFFLALAEEIELLARTGDQPALFERLSADDANLRQALELARGECDTDLELRLVTALWRYWFVRGHVREGTAWVEDALSKTDDPPARALLGRCMLRFLHASDFEAVLEDASRVRRACEQAGDDYGLAQIWNLIGRLEASGLGRVSVGEEAWRRALEYAERGGYAAEKAESTGWLMVMAVFGPLPEPTRASSDATTSSAEPATTRRCVPSPGSSVPSWRRCEATSRSHDSSSPRDTSGSRHSASTSGPPTTRRRGSTSRCSQAILAAPPRCFAGPTRRSSRWASGASTPRSAACSPTPSRRRAWTRMPSTSAARASGSRRRTTSSRRCSGGRRWRRCWPGEASSTAPRGWRENRSSCCRRTW